MIFLVSICTVRYFLLYSGALWFAFLTRFYVMLVITAVFRTIALFSLNFYRKLSPKSHLFILFINKIIINI